ncbi:two-component sensor histidine kinase [Cellulomonas sp. DKR-3]|uniref:histidine kinase n=1 Tax=Cellulomonas fulva TaxID=2835530 RepID=A0ABS5TXG9_9CELL|nr:histidine kinase [Cellulomonas fulva]MBT0993792.1 two-component sensor histidine kinase [Cellulomonas fulva]
MVDLRRVRAAWASYDVTVRDLPLALAILTATFVPSLQDQGTQLGDLPGRPHDALTGVAIALQALPLVVRRRFPAACLALVSAGFALDQLAGFHTVAGVALPIAIFSTAAHLRSHRRTAAVVATAAYVALAVALADGGSGEGVTGFAEFYVVLAVAWGIGVWLRQSRAAEAEHRRLAAEGARAAERAVIAHELHDVVTHHVTAMVVQCEAARYLAQDPARLDDALTAVAATGRRAISDLRHLLDVLDPQHGPDPRTPTAGEVGELVEQARRSGQPVEYAQEGTTPHPPGGAEIAAYRVVQEALTNALKHAHGLRTVVRVRHDDDVVDVEVTTAGEAQQRVAPAGGGRGLAGLRDRVGLLGGELTAGPAPDGSFVVRARIPAGTRP